MIHEQSILLVEDNATDEALTLRALGKTGIKSRVIVMRDGAAALDYLLGRGAYAGRDTRDLPAVVLLDLKLPKMDGVEVLQHLRRDQRTKLLPVVILTSSNEERDRLDGYASGANSYVQKPVESLEFTNAVMQLGVYWLLTNERPPISPPHHAARPPAADPDAAPPPPHRRDTRSNR